MAGQGPSRFPIDVLPWAEERLANSQRIALTKTGDDHLGWLEDLAYWREIVARLKERSALLREANIQRQRNRELDDAHKALIRRCSEKSSPMKPDFASDHWLYTDFMGDVWRLVPLHDPSSPFTILAESKNPRGWRCETRDCEHRTCQCGHAECGHADENVQPNCSGCLCAGFTP